MLTIEDTSLAHLNHSLFIFLVSRIIFLNLNEQQRKAIECEEWSHSHLIKSWPLWWLRCNPLLLSMDSIGEWPRRQWWSHLTHVHLWHLFLQPRISLKLPSEYSLEEVRNYDVSMYMLLHLWKYLFTWPEVMDEEIELPSHLSQGDLNTFGL